MLKSNYKSYLLYFWCNVFAVALFYAFASLFTNDEFMNPVNVNSSISSNVYAPSVLTAIFGLLFLTYSYGVFLKNRKSEYGILMTLGMNDTEVIHNIIAESIIIHLVSLMCGLLLGTGLSFLFYVIIHYCIGISQISVKMNLKPYEVTAAYYGVIIVVMIIYQIFKFAGMQIVDMLKERVNGEKRKEGHRARILIGLTFVAVSVIVMLKEYKYSSTNIWFISMLLMMIGIGLVISNLEVALSFLKKRFSKRIEKHCIEVSHITRHFNSYKSLSFVAIWLIVISVFFAGLSAVVYPSLIDNAITYSPYDMVYAQLYGMNKMKDVDVYQILKKHQVFISEEKKIPYLRSNVCNLLAISEVNKVFGCSYKVKEGEYLTLYQYDLDDGYGHEVNMPDRMSIELKNTDLNLRCIGEDVRILLNVNPAISENTLIVSDNDYVRIKEESNNYEPGIIKMFNFADWKNSKDGVMNLQQHMADANGLDKSDQRCFNLSSKIEAYNTAKQSGQILLFMMAFVVILFCISADIMIHFKIKSEMEDEKKMFYGLFRIGITDKESMRIVYNKNICYYLIPMLIGCFIGVFYNYVVNGIYGYGMTGMKYSLCISILLLAIQFIIVKQYSKNEIKNMGM